MRKIFKIKSDWKPKTQKPWLPEPEKDAERISTSWDRRLKGRGIPELGDLICLFWSYHSK